MAILSDYNPPAAPAAATASRRFAFGGMRDPSQPRPDSKVWGSWGYVSPTGFIDLPHGFAVDTMSPADTRGQNAEFIGFQESRNELLVQVQELCAELEAGEEIFIPANPPVGTFAMKFRRVKDKLIVAPSNGGIDGKALLRAKPAAAQQEQEVA
jgi:hypothetical protein